MVIYLTSRPALHVTALAVYPEKTEFKQGKLLAGKYCATCHQLPWPALLPKKVWSGSVLPAMGLFLGTTKPTRAFDDQVKNFFATQPVMSVEEWKELQDYYIDSAPESLSVVQNREKPHFGLTNFEVMLPKESIFFSKIALASYVKILGGIAGPKLFINDGFSNTLFTLNDHLDIIQRLKMPGTLVDVDFNARPFSASFIGRNYMASIAKDGSVYPLELSGFNLLLGKKPTFTTLARPLKSLRQDLNGDGLSDVITAEFGNLSGKLSWWTQFKTDKYREHILKESPGAIDFKIFDYNNDGLPDIWALFAQGDEGIFLFTNKRKGRFETSRVLSFPPVYGSSAFQLIDLDQDGFKDILYTCGDNADLSQVLKPYHGVYVFLNDGHNHFRQRYFYAINGCYKAIAMDFDGDGDLDIAAISAFPSAKTPWEAFTYLENRGRFKYTTFTLPLGTPLQKGLTMDCEDYNGDGKIDILLGNKFYTSKVDEKAQPLFILLKNISLNKRELTK